MKLRKSFGLTAASALVAVSLSAAVSRTYVEWSKGPAQFLMTKEEVAAWKGITNDAEAQKFVDLFWARRDPTPTTPLNEFKQDFDVRVKLADEKFTVAKTKGSVTDRGKFLILLGPPSRAGKLNERRDSMQDSDVITRDAAGNIQEAAVPTEMWIYELDRVPKFAPQRKFDLAFVDQQRTGLYKLGRTSSANPIDLAKRAVQAAIVSPNLTQVPVYETRRVETRTVPAAAIQPTTSSTTKSGFTNPVFGTTAAEIKAGKTSGYKPLYVTYAEGVTPAGEYFIPLQLFVPKGSVVTPDSNATFFGTIEDANGQVVATFEEPSRLTPSKDDLFYDKSLVLPSGKYKGYFGLAVDGKPAMVTTTAFDLKSLDKAEPGTSKLILSNNIYALPAAQRPTDPFAFGGIKVVPKGDKTFRKSDELWFFVELRNPGVDDKGKTSLQVKTDVEGMVNKKKVTMSSPLQEQAGEPLKGVENHFALGNSIPLAGFSPGDYTIKVKVIDTIKKKTYNLTETFKVIAEKS